MDENGGSEVQKSVVLKNQVEVTAEFYVENQDGVRLDILNVTTDGQKICVTVAEMDRIV